MAELPDRWSPYETELRQLCKEKFGFEWDKIPKGFLYVDDYSLAQGTKEDFLIAWFKRVEGTDTTLTDLHEYISEQWRRNTAPMNCHSLYVMAEGSSKYSFKELVEITNKHELFFETEDKRINRENRTQDEVDKQIAERIAYRNTFGYRLRKRMNVWIKENYRWIPLHTIRAMLWEDKENPKYNIFRNRKDINVDNEIMRLEQERRPLKFNLLGMNMYTNKDPYVHEHNTTGFNEIYKTLFPAQAPHVKEAIIDDYLKMSLELGVPMESPSLKTAKTKAVVEKGGKAEPETNQLQQDVLKKQLYEHGGGVAHIWHQYGLLASQWLESENKNWKEEEDEENHPFESYTEVLKKYDAKDKAEYWMVIAGVKRLEKTLDDEVKIFSLLIHLYYEFSKNPEWCERWNKFVEMDEIPDQFKPGHFAQAVLRRDYYRGESHYKLWRNDRCLRLLEGFKSHGSDDFESYIENTYFTP